MSHPRTLSLSQGKRGGFVQPQTLDRSSGIVNNKFFLVKNRRVEFWSGVSFYSLFIKISKKVTVHCPILRFGQWTVDSLLITYFKIFIYALKLHFLLKTPLRKNKYNKNKELQF